MKERMNVWTVQKVRKCRSYRAGSSYIIIKIKVETFNLDFQITR